MEDGPTMTKLIILLISVTTLYILFILPIMSGSYLVVTKGDFDTLGSFMNEKLKLIY